MSAEIIRAATNDDAARIGSIYITASLAALGPAASEPAIEAAAAGRHAMWLPLTKPGARQWMLVLGVDDVRGFVSFGAIGKPSEPYEAHLYALYIEPEYWGRGYGSRLMSEATRTFLDASLASCALWVQEENQRARDFYSSRGWCFTGERRTNDRGTFLLYSSALVVA